MDMRAIVVLLVGCLGMASISLMASGVLGLIADPRREIPRRMFCFGTGGMVATVFAILATLLDRPLLFLIAIVAGAFSSLITRLSADLRLPPSQRERSGAQALPAASGWGGRGPRG